MVIGGSAFYRAMLPRATRLYLTRIDAEFEGDAWFPEIDARDWYKNGFGVLFICKVRTGRFTTEVTINYIDAFIDDPHGDIP